MGSAQWKAALATGSGPCVSRECERCPPQPRRGGQTGQKLCMGQQNHSCSKDLRQLLSLPCPYPSASIRPGGFSSGHKHL